MFFWFVGAALVIAWLVFRDPAIDYRVLVFGALVPDLIDGPFGGSRVAHTLVASAGLLAAVMLATRGHRHLRRRLLFLPIGTFVHLIADGIWGKAETFWWPFLGRTLDSPLPSFAHAPAVIVLQELVGLAAIVWFVRTTGLTDPEARRTLLRTGRLPRPRLGG